jgi:hypothetical protein
MRRAGVCVDAIVDGPTRRAIRGEMRSPLGAIGLPLARRRQAGNRQATGTNSLLRGGYRHEYTPATCKRHCTRVRGQSGLARCQGFLRNRLKSNDKRLV